MLGGFQQTSCEAIGEKESFVEAFVMVNKTCEVGEIRVSEMFKIATMFGFGSVRKCREC